MRHDTKLKNLIILSLIGVLSACVDLIKTEGPIGELHTVGKSSSGSMVTAQEWGVPITTNDGQPIFIQSVVYRHETGPERRPLVLINHGDPANSQKRRDFYGVNTLRWAAQWFAYQGYNVVVPLRAGFGKSQGSGQLKHNRCGTMDYERTGNYVADEILKITQHFQAQDWVDPANVVLVGQSWGGIGVIAAAARQPDGVQAVIDFAGITAKSIRTGNLCNRSNAHRAFSKFASFTKLPVLWVFTENDTFNDTEEVRAIFDVYSQAKGGRAELAMLPPFAKNGHSLIYRKDGRTLWTPIVKRFLTESVQTAQKAF